ncbi:DNA damage-inducible protein 1 [Apiotrichum porosum]|uniref:DNA damage-inducible protein 1 n=1 Tax=Apiotrichum porosum TaxID=105984 RepID=A0A427Y0X1_9TREE|nr:DNA damage-inducible protein 1 [Apiotrichum porosum]RSH84680.1 DNA damage-inducible protein 1 [Apiotrichum porosum]
MRLTIIAPESVYEHEVDPSMEVRDVKALIEAETGASVSSQTLSTDSGVALITEDKTLSSYGLTGTGATLFLTFRDPRPVPSSSQQPSDGVSLSSDADFERMRLQALGDPNLMNQLRQANPEFAAAIQTGGSRFRDLLLNADPYDIEAQKKIEEAIRMEAVLENMQHAMEFSPESFGHVTMLYINVEVNGHPVKAFVDSGAQTTIISPECAESCGIMRLIDKRFAGVAQGVGTAKILGRIHSAQIKLDKLFLPVAFSVLEGQSVDLLFGLDMLKRHQACIDLSTNTLRIGATEIPFLSEHQLPIKDRAPPHDSAGEASASTAPVASSSTAGPSTSRSTAQTPAPDNSQRSRDIDTLVGLGATRDHAAQLLEAAGGNVDVAASMLFG